MKSTEDIMRELEELSEETDEYGGEERPTYPDWLIDAKEDEGLPPYSDEELAALRTECDANADALNAIEAKIDELKEEFFEIAGYYPRFHNYFRM